MVQVVGVRLRQSGRIYYYLPNDTVYTYNQKVIVENEKSKQLAEVAYPSVELPESDIPDELKPILKVATAAEEKIAQQNKVDSREAFKIAKEKINDHGLAMKLIEGEYAFDRSKLIFRFTADGRIDFRHLVKDLAGIFKTRIELRQVGIRDEAKILGGIGPCGRQLCCSTFLGDFIPVSIKMAKDQNLSLNQTKISGLCGRLMCCLKYENDTYKEAKREMPDYGKEINTPAGRGRVVGLNLLERIVKVRLLSQDGVVEFEQEELKEYAATAKGASVGREKKEDSNG